jgi:hypothetical protein
MQRSAGIPASFSAERLRDRVLPFYRGRDLAGVEEAQCGLLTLYPKVRP